MKHQDVELLAIGVGPSNLALAIALEELAPDDLARNSMLIDRADTVVWQQGLLLPWATSQISFLKDLVTLRNPSSEFSFVNFLHASGRLDHFINMGNLWPYRSEISDYFAWVANSLSKVKVELGRECVAVGPRRDAAGKLVGWSARFADGSTVSSRYLVIAPGRDPHIPEVLAGLSADRVIHGTRYTPRLATLPRDLPYRVAVIGGGQSAAEMFCALQDDLPEADIAWVMRSLGPNALQSSKFTNEMYYPSFVDKVYGASPAGREEIRREMHRTNYSGVEPDLLQNLYSDRYVKGLAGQDRTSLVTMVDLVGAEETEDGVVLQLADRATGEITRLERDLVFLGTGFRGEMPALVRGLADELKLSEITVTRRYQLVLDEPSDAACYLQGLNEDTHGVGDSLLSVVVDRTAATVQDIVSRRHHAGRTEFADAGA
ncbi:L-ornithine N5-oxygenase [Kibdelosporangium banguiense]|uniref:L-lysine N6-monooxygenase MbtG n=1 Tax=Kibdelosporangium banguiense TaxID=1365924 RepID=A0ABS4TPZ3_9PSEU|nr:SidA/IucD/PvdA family monooxygenase [Kibdelosporangium banguiense]MBP2326474.1 L-ornithine N5-oxygenase [Kibdelosporangium banguiense]